MICENREGKEKATSSSYHAVLVVAKVERGGTKAGMLVYPYKIDPYGLLRSIHIFVNDDDECARDNSKKRTYICNVCWLFLRGQHMCAS